MVYQDRGLAWTTKEDYDKAIADYNETIRLDPEDAWGYNALAWLLATCPNDKYRDGKKAVELSTKACEMSGWKDTGSIDTLAASYAEAGDFENAVKWQERAIELASEGEKDMFRPHLALYQAGKPFRDEPKKK